jgi:hypothetical protein
MLSALIPAHNEEGHIAETVQNLAAALREAGIAYEILVINDNSSDAPSESWPHWVPPELECATSRNFETINF